MQQRYKRPKSIGCGIFYFAIHRLADAFFVSAFVDDAITLGYCVFKWTRSVFVTSFWDGLIWLRKYSAIPSDHTRNVSTCCFMIYRYSAAVLPSFIAALVSRPRWALLGTKTNCFAGFISDIAIYNLHMLYMPIYTTKRIS